MSDLTDLSDLFIVKNPTEFIPSWRKDFGINRSPIYWSCPKSWLRFCRGGGGANLSQKRGTSNPCPPPGQGVFSPAPQPGRLPSARTLRVPPGDMRANDATPEAANFLRSHRRTLLFVYFSINMTFDRFFGVKILKKDTNLKNLHVVHL